MKTEKRVLGVLPLILAGVIVLAFPAPPASAEPTDVTVRVISKGAKFVGTSAGGASVVIRDADTGAILAEGITSGDSGDTGQIMLTPRLRGEPLSTPEAAAFMTSLDIETPRRIQISAVGPLGNRQAANRVTVTQWLVPGKHLTAWDGILLELPGLVVDVLAPVDSKVFPDGIRHILLRADVTAMCGCPFEPGGIWDAEKIEVRALLSRNGERMASVPLGYAGTPSRFEGTIAFDRPGIYEAAVYAYSRQDGNAGVKKIGFSVCG